MDLFNFFHIGWNQTTTLRRTRPPKTLSPNLLLLISFSRSFFGGKMIYHLINFKLDVAFLTSMAEEPYQRREEEEGEEKQHL